MLKKIFLFVFVAAILMGFSTEKKFGNSHVMNVPAATIDTSFTANAPLGWSNFPAYIVVQQDSVKFEIVLIKEVTQNTDWQIYWEVGTLSESCRPETQQTVEYHEPERSWMLTFLPNGKCMIRFNGGKLPTGNPVYIPIQTSFKR